jgi:hypothetical protein
LKSKREEDFRPRWLMTQQATFSSHGEIQNTKKNDMVLLAFYLFIFSQNAKNHQPSLLLLSPGTQSPK